MSWLAGWKYRKSHVIEPASGAGTDYQIRIIVHYGSGTDSGEHVYLNGKCRSDFGDVRFTSDDGVTLLDYWIEELEDGVNKWFVSNGMGQPFNQIDYPPAIYYNGKTYIVWQGADLDPYITYYDHSTKKWGSIIKVGDNPLSGDSHGAPSIILDAEGYIHVFYGCHQTSIIHSKSDDPEDISSWTKLTAPVASATYPKPLRIGDEIYLFYRKTLADRQPENYVKSTDNGETWSEEKTIIDFGQNTTIYASNPEEKNGKIHIAWTYIPDASVDVRKNIYHAYLNLADGHLYAMDGTDLGEKVEKTEADAYCLVESSGDYEANRPVLHLDEDGNPILIYPFEEASGWTFHFARWNGQSWETGKICDTNYKWNHADFIVHSTYIEAYLTVGGESGREGGDIEKWIWNGSSWSKKVTVMTQEESELPLNYPIIPVNYADELKVLFCQRGSTDLKVYAYGNNGFLTSKSEKYAVFWVKVAGDLSSGPQTIYIYYGNENAETTSNGFNTFLFFDDFEDQDIDGWEAVSGTWSAEEKYVKTEDDSARLRTQSTHTDVKWGFKARILSTKSGHHMHTLLMGDGGVTNCYALNVKSNSYGQPRGSLTYKQGDQPGNVTIAEWNIENTYAWHSFIVGRTSSGDFKVWMDRELVASGKDTTLAESAYFMLTSKGTSKKCWDNIFIAKYVDPEPAHGSWGSEESASEPTTRFGIILRRCGEAVWIQKPVDSTTDEYGNVSSEYETDAYVYAVLKISGERERFLIPGVTEQADAVAFLEPTTEIQPGYRIKTAHNGDWQVIYVRKLLKAGRVHHIQAYLKRVEA